MATSTQLLGLFCALCVLVPRAVNAQPPASSQRAATGPALNWTRQPGAEACIGPVALAQRVEAHIGRPVFVAAPDAVVAVEGVVAPDPDGGYRAELTVSDGRGNVFGSRALTAGKDCHALDESLVLVIVVTLRPQQGYLGGIELPQDIAEQLDALFADVSSEPSADALPSPQGGRADTADEASAPTRDTDDSGAGRATPADTETPPPSFDVELGGALLAGVQPGVAPGLRAGLGVRWSPIGRIALAVELSSTTSQRLRDGETRARTAASGQRVTIDYCPIAARLGPVQTTLCARGLLGRVAVATTGLVADGEEALTWGAFGPALDARLPLTGRLALSAALSPTYRPWRPRATFVGFDGTTRTLLQPANFGGSFQLGLRVRID